MARRSGLGKGLGALIPTDEAGRRRRRPCCRRSRSARIEPNQYQPRAHFDEEALVDADRLDPRARCAAADPGAPDRAAGSSSSSPASAGGGRPSGPGSTTIPALVRDGRGPGASLEQALVENLHREDLNAARGGGGLPAADRGLRPHPGGGRPPGRQEPRRRWPTPCGCSSSRRRSRSWWPTARLTAGHARALLGIADRALPGDAGPPGGRPRTCRSATVEEVVRAKRRRRRDGRAGGRARPSRLAAPGPAAAGLLELEELLSDHLDTRVQRHDGGRSGAGWSSSSPPSRISSGSTGS